MAEHVELILRVDNTEAIQKIRETQLAVAEMNKTITGKGDEEIKLIKETISNLEKIKKSREESFNTDALDDNIRKVSDVSDKMGELTNAATKNESAMKKASGGLSSFGKSAGLVGAAITLILGLLNKLVETFKNTTSGINLITRANLIWKQGWYDLLHIGDGVKTTLEDLYEIADRTNKLRIIENKHIVRNAQLQTRYNELMDQSSNTTKSYDERLRLLTEAEDTYKSMLDGQIAILEERLAIIQATLKNRKDDIQLQAEEANIMAQLIPLQVERNKALEKQKAELQKERIHNLMQEYIAWVEESKKIQEEYQNKSLELQKAYEDAYIESLSGEERLKAIRDYEIKQLNIFREEILELGKLTPEMQAQFDFLAKQIWENFYKAMAGYAKLTPEQQTAVSNALREGIAELPGLQKLFIETYESTHGGKSYKETIWDLMGITEEEKEEAIKTLKDAASQFGDVLDGIFDRRVADAARTRQLITDQIAETQRELDAEVELMEQGYANNVEAKRKEIEELKKQRDKALQEEEKALKAQRAMDTVSQTINLITATSNILKEYTKLGPIGIIAATAAIAAMFVSFAAAKSKALAVTKLAKGGSGTEAGIIQGRRHSEGGEPFLSHIEVERGEAWGVLSRKATDKYGNLFHDIVHAFNNDIVPEVIKPKIINDVKVNNDGSNERLDKLIKEQQKLYKNMTHAEQVLYYGKQKVIKRGNSIKIIG